MPKQHNLASEVSATGVAPHSSVRVQITLKSAPPDTGIIFISRALTFGLAFEVETLRSIGHVQSYAGPAMCNRSCHSARRGF